MSDAKVFAVGILVGVVTLVLLAIAKDPERDAAQCASAFAHARTWADTLATAQHFHCPVTP